MPGQLATFGVLGMLGMLGMGMFGFCDPLHV
jgi:hypothetical protein